jgi:hypothetical protein
MHDSVEPGKPARAFLGLERREIVAPRERSIDAIGRRSYTPRMAKYRGTMRRSDLEGGHWQLETEDGTRYVLEDVPAAVAHDGATVELDGKVDDDAMGFMMTGPTLKVKSGKRT